MGSNQEAILYGTLPTLFLLLFVGLPLVVVASFAWWGDPLRGDHEPGWDTFRSAVSHIAEAAYYRNRILFTLELALASTLATLAVGVPLAFVFSQYEFPGRRALRALFTTPFVLPAIVVALALHAYVGPRGLLGVDLLSPLGDFGAVLLAHVFYNASLVMRLVGNYWERVPPVYREAARTLGARPWAAFLRVDLPLLRTPLTAAALLVFVFSLTSFAVVKLLASDRTGTIEVLIFEERQGILANYELVATLALLQVALTYPALWVFVALQRRLRTFAVPNVAPSRSPLPPAGYAGLALAALLLAGPLVALAGASLGGPGHWSLQPYADVFSGRANLGTTTAAQAALNSLRFALAALVLALAMGWLSGLAVQRARGGRWAEALLTLPLGLSSIVIALGLFLSWDGRWLPDLRSSNLSIVIAHALVAFPLTTRILSPSLEGIEPRLREAARTLGARPTAVVRLVDLPLTYPALGVAAVYALGSSLGEFGATLSLLRTPESTTIPLAIASAFGRGFGPYPQYALVLACLLMAVSLASFLLMERLRVRAWGDFA